MESKKNMYTITYNQLDAGCVQVGKSCQQWRMMWRMMQARFFFTVTVEMQNLETGDFERGNRNYPYVSFFQGLAQTKLQFPGQQSEFFPLSKRHLSLKKHLSNINFQTETFKQYQFPRGISFCSFGETLSKLFASWLRRNKSSRTWRRTCLCTKNCSMMTNATSAWTTLNPWVCSKAIAIPAYGSSSFTIDTMTWSRHLALTLTMSCRKL